MDRIDRNFLRLSGRQRAMEQLLTVLLIDWAERSGPDPICRIDGARRNSMFTLQVQARPIDEATDLEAAAMVETLDEIFAEARANLLKARPGA
jgi:hypothetical protein